MKTNNLFGIWLLFLCATVLSGCNNYLLNGKDGDEEEDNEEVWYNNIPEGNFFSRGNTLRFYYIDEKGNDLINPSDLKTFPRGAKSWTIRSNAPTTTSAISKATPSATTAITTGYFMIRKNDSITAR